jgi:hypothetical protein
LRPHAHTDPLTTTCTTKTPLLCVCPRKTFKKTPKTVTTQGTKQASQERKEKKIKETSKRFTSFPQEKKNLEISKFCKKFSNESAVQEN